MKVPIFWLKKYIKLPDTLSGLTNNLTMVGHMLDKIENKNGETIIDLELRGNRADCYSIIGIAREISAIYNQKIKNLEYQKTYQIKKLKSVDLSIKSPLVKRVAAVEIKNINLKKSPLWLKKALESYGVESINNIIDLTNYVMVETGQPMHAFDLNKLGKLLEIKLANNGDLLTTIQGSSLKLTADDLVWKDENGLLSVAGAIGGKNSSIDNLTKNVLLEAANYDQVNIRRTIYRHKLFTEAGIRHEKDLDPNMVLPAIERFLHLLRINNWGESDFQVYDYYPQKNTPIEINLDFNQLNRLTGIAFNKNEINEILKRLNFEGQNKIQIPTYRTDVKVAEDLIEEIIRIYGYDKIPAKTLALEIPKNTTPKYIWQENEIKNASSSIGFNEIISLSFVPEQYKNYSQVFLQNPPNPDNKYLRNSLWVNLYLTAKRAVNERAENVQLFEVGKIFIKNKNAYTEKRRLGLIYWKNKNYNFSEFKSKILGIFEKLEIDFPDFVKTEIDYPFSKTYILKIGRNKIGFGGNYNGFYYSEIDLDSILNYSKKHKVYLWPKYPPQIEDITLTFPPKTRLGDVVSLIIGHWPLITKIELKDIYQDAYTFRLCYQDPQKTLTDAEVAQIRTQILAKIKSKFGGIPK